PQNDVTLKMPAFEWVHVQLHQQKGMISLSPPTICNSATTQGSRVFPHPRLPPPLSFSEDGCTERQKPTAL
ncbi:hypothetical protein EYX84_18635, partial [Escherichia coli]